MPELVRSAARSTAADYRTLVGALAKRAARIGAGDPEGAAQEAVKRSLAHPVSRAAVEYYFDDVPPSTFSAPGWTLLQLLGWLHGVLRLVVLEELVRTRRELPADTLPERPDPASGPLDQVIDAELHGIVQDALATLSADHRSALLLRLEGIKYIDIARRLGVSRTPVRETLFRLEREGLVRIVEGKGAFVASYTIEDVVEIYQMRIALEPLAARLACPHLDIDDLSRVEEQLNRYKAKPSLMTSDSASWLKLGREFHSLFIRTSSNNRLIQVIEGMQDQIDLVRGIGRTISMQATRESTLQEHIAILRALKARDPDRAERAVRVHLQNGLKHRLDGLQVKA